MNEQTVTDLLARRHSADVFVPQCKNGPTHTATSLQIFDAWAMARSWSKPRVTGYEIKVARGDFLQDDKWVGYLPYCNCFSFVCPHGLIKLEEVPTDVGLLYVSKNGTKLYTKKKAKYRPIPAENFEVIFRYILMCRTAITGEVRSDVDRFTYWRGVLEDKGKSAILGHKVSRVLRQRYREDVIQAERNNEQLRQQNERLQGWAELLKGLGISPMSFPSESRFKRAIQDQDAVAGMLESVESMQKKLVHFAAKLHAEKAEDNWEQEEEAGGC